MNFWMFEITTILLSSFFHSWWSSRLFNMWWKLGNLTSPKRTLCITYTYFPMEGQSSAIANGSHLALFMAERYSQLEPPIVKHSSELRVWRFSFFLTLRASSQSWSYWASSIFLSDCLSGWHSITPPPPPPQHFLQILYDFEISLVKLRLWSQKLW